MALDAAKNFAKADLAAGINSAATSCTLSSGHAARLPSVAFNGVIYNATDYGDPADAYHAGEAEVVRVTNIAGSSLTITRAQEGTSAVNLNTPDKQYVLVAGLTAKVVGTDLAANFDAKGAASSAQSYAIQRANHTGTQSADTISDFAAAVYTATAAILQQGSNITLTPDSKAETITIAASGGGGGSGTKTIFAYSAWVENNPPAANFATLGVREYEAGVPQAVMVFDDAVAQSAYALAYIKEGTNLSSGVTVSLLVSSDAASGDIGWTVNLGRFSSSGGTLVWGNAETITAAAVPGSADETVVMAATIASGDLPSGLTGEEWVLVEVTSDVANWTADDVACVLGVSGKAVA